MRLSQFLTHLTCLRLSTIKSLFLLPDEQSLFSNTLGSLFDGGLPVTANIYDALMSRVSSLSTLELHNLAAGI